ncbi:MAG TPA: hypothetical protein VMG30_06975 [Acidobacteriota bacterium]|nr:hypothetical protein [Acidobacteriota bacterium]
MRVRHALIGALLLCSLSVSLPAGEKYSLKVLYIGDPGTPRAKEFMQFLEEHFTRAQALSRESFNPGRAAGWDVVLLEWPQAQITITVDAASGAPPDLEQIMEKRLGPSPLGPRESWSKPTVLLGSAGLNLAMAWKIGGGSG